MPGVEVVEKFAFADCEALTDVECDKLEIIGEMAFKCCKSLRSINLSSAKIVERSAFAGCAALTNVGFGKELERIEEKAFCRCTSLERITIPLKDNMIAADGIFRMCKKLKYVDLVEEAVLHDTIAALLLEEWKKVMNREIDALNQILPFTRAGDADDFDDVGGMALEIRRWISSLLGKIVRYKAQHRHLLNEAATTLQLQYTLPNDIVFKNVLPFLELPSFTFEGED